MLQVQVWDSPASESAAPWACLPQQLRLERQIQEGPAVAVAAWGGLAKSVGSQQNLYLLYVIFINNYLYK